MQFQRILLLVSIFTDLSLGADIIYADYFTGKIIQINEESYTSNIRVEHPANVWALDMDWRTQTIYYSDVDTSINGIYMVTVDGTVTNLTSAVSGWVPGIALDWINNNLYFIILKDAGVGTINKLDLTTLQHDILYTDVNDISTIVVDPRISQGYMYWSAEGSPGYIARAQLDGSDMERIIQTDISRPYGFTIDLSDDSLYWVDSLSKMFFRCDLNGMNRVALPINTDAYIYGLTVYNGVRLLWTTSSENNDTINEIDLTNCARASCIVTPLQNDIPYIGPIGIKILDQTQQPNGTSKASSLDACGPQRMLLSIILPVLLLVINEQRTCLT